MKTILLWDPRFPDRRPLRLTVDDTLASAAVRAGVAAVANPADAGALSTRAALDSGTVIEVLLQHGLDGTSTRRVFLPLSVALGGAAADVVAGVAQPLPGGTPTPTPTPTSPFDASVYDLNFVANTYKGGVVTNLLAEAGNFVGGLYPQESNGSLTAVGGNTLQRTANGLEVWPNRTNVVLWRRDLTNAAWVTSNVTALKNQTGKNGAANDASSITATAAGDTIMQALTLASSVRAQSAYVRRLVGTGTLEMTMDGGATWILVSTTGT